MQLVFLFLIAFCGSLILVLAAFPLYAYVRSLVIIKPVDRDPLHVEPVSIIIAAYNEELFIRQKISFFLNEQEWIEGSEIIVVSAGSTDDTEKILLEYKSNARIKTIIINDHIVKPLALNYAVNAAENKILVFSDCRQIIMPGSIRSLVNYFKDPSIGVVNSTISDTLKGGKTSLVRRVLNWTSFNESISGSSTNIHGALYAQRRSVFRPFPNDILFDDLYAAVSTICQNKRLIQARDVTILDVSFKKYYTKNRLERLARGLLVFLFNHWAEIKKMPANSLLRFVIYKYLKLSLPVLFLGLLVALIPFVAPLLTAKTVLYFTILFLFSLGFRTVREFIFVMLWTNVYFLGAIFKFIFLKKRHVSWEKLKPEQVF